MADGKNPNIYSGLKNYVGGSDSDNLFSGVWNLNQKELTQYDPYISGYAFIVWTKLPQFMIDANKDIKIGDKGIADALKHMTEKNFKSLSGISDITLGTEDITQGFAGNAYGVATGISKENTQFSIAHQELSGSPMRKIYDYWVTGIRDPETGLATYHGQVAKGLPYSAKNHTGELLYIVTDPTGRGNGIEFACYFTNVFPTKIPQDHLNFTNGEHSVAEVTIDFKGNYHASQQINELAAKYLNTAHIQDEYQDYKVTDLDRSPESRFYDPEYNKNETWPTQGNK